ncbi:MAG: ABC transporter permease [Symploca sp. SIO2C1]|nr:ABC transporter permease [Symploca sp. SIO2C1]
MSSLVSIITGSVSEVISTIIQYWKIILVTTKVEFDKRYSGSVLGIFWVFLYPALLLSVYLFVYLVIFQIRFPGYSEFDYVLYVFCGLIPYIGFSEAISNGSLCIKQNIHLIKNVMLPIELVPIRAVMISMVTQVVSLAILIVLTTFGGSLSWHLIWLPLIFLLQIMFLVGLVWILAAVAVPLPDVSYFVNLLLLLLMFLSPIGFKMDMVPNTLKFIVYVNPLSYMLEMYRSSLLYGKFPEPLILIPYVIMCIIVFALGATFFERFKHVLVDYE